MRPHQSLGPSPAESSSHQPCLPPKREEKLTLREHGVHPSPFPSVGLSRRDETGYLALPPSRGSPWAASFSPCQQSDPHSRGGFGKCAQPHRVPVLALACQKMGCSHRALLPLDVVTEHNPVCTPQKVTEAPASWNKESETSACCPMPGWSPFPIPVHTSGAIPHPQPRALP